MNKEILYDQVVVWQPKPDITTKIYAVRDVHEDSGGVNIWGDMSLPVNRIRDHRFDGGIIITYVIPHEMSYDDTGAQS